MGCIGGGIGWKSFSGHVRETPSNRCCNMSTLALLDICWLTFDMVQFERVPKKIFCLTLQEPFDLLKLNPSPQKSYFGRDMYQFQSPFLKAQQLDSKGLHLWEFQGCILVPSKLKAGAEHWSFGRCFSFFNWVICWFQALIFRDVSVFITSPPNPEETKKTSSHGKRWVPERLRWWIYIQRSSPIRRPWDPVLAFRCAVFGDKKIQLPKSNSR